MNLLRPLALAFSLALVTSPALADEPAKVKNAENRTPLAFPEGASGRIVTLKKANARFDTPNAKIGEVGQGWLCAKTGDILWGPKVLSLFNQRLIPAFRSELEKQRYPLPRTSDAIFEENRESPKSSEELHAGLLFKEVAANFCSKGSDGIIGGVYMKVFWQIYAPDQQKVVYEISTEGSYQTDSAEKIPYGVFFERAFAAATRNLLAERGFTNAITNTQAGAPVKKDALVLKGSKPFGDALNKNITMLRAAVATIISDNSSGSGFFVSNDGHLLTNSHVVGNARFVKVKLATGRELVGEVLRSDRPRDVALIKAEPVGIQPLALRADELNISDEVYVLGSPLGDKFNTSLTKGILSGYRTLNDKRYLQSDVAILPGNSGGPLLDTKGSVAGITVLGLGAKGIAGMNFFIPIGEALSTLDLEIR